MSTIRTPPSLKWLIDKRSRLLGELLKHEKLTLQRIEEGKQRILEAERSLEQAKLELSHIESAGPTITELLRLDIQSIDNTLGLHEIQINPDIIPPIRTPDAERSPRHGGMTRGIFERLKLAGGQSVSTFELIDFVATKIGVELTADNYQAFRKKILWRLKNLCQQGKVKRLHQVKGAVVGRWMLTDDPIKLEAMQNQKLGRPSKKQN